MKFLLFALLMFMTAVSGFGAETNALVGKIKVILPNQGWSIEDHKYSLIIKGPEVRTLWPMSLPPLQDKQKLWQDYSTTQPVEVVVAYQAPITDEDFAELENLKIRFETMMKQINNRRLEKGGEAHVRKFGFVRLPDYRSTSSSLFVSDNVGARGSPLEVDPDAVRETVRKIYGVIEAYCKSDVETAKKKARNSVPERAK